MPTTPHTLTALSPLDGRYSDKLDALRPFFSEYGLMHYRLKIEIRWLECLAQIPEVREVPQLGAEAQHLLENLVAQFSVEDALRIKAIEAETNHDVKALEYFIKERVKHNAQLSDLSEFIHFGCTSEDINNLAYACLLKDARETIFLPLLTRLIDTLRALAHTHAAQPMLSRTHGQTASPTTLGKEFANVVARLTRQYDQIRALPLLGKFNGAVGNYNAHVVAYPEIDWISISQQFVEAFGLTWNPWTTQIEPHDTLAEFFHAIIRVNNILLDFNRDVWGYISQGYFTQQLKPGETGSSTMPHKINPIDFENAEGNLGLSTAMLDHMANKLPLSRWQRDLTDSTVLRNMGVAIGHAILAYESCLKGLGKLEVNTKRLEEDLNDNWEVLGEAIQTVMRRHGIEQPYEKLKALTRGNRIDSKTLSAFIDGLALPPAIKEQLKHLTPQTYLGKATDLARKV